MSRSATELQNAKNKTTAFYKSVGFEVNESKTKVIVLYKQGHKLSNPSHLFLNDNKPIEVVIYLCGQ